MDLCTTISLPQLAANIKKAEGLHLQVFFSAKTHKEACPFRAIVTERGTWQRQVAAYLQKHLSSLSLSDPFLVRNSEAVVRSLRFEKYGHHEIFSVDVQDLFYSIPHPPLLAAVQSCIESNGELAFRNATGISIEDFLELLIYYLKSTYIGWKDDLYLQKSGVCIGSCVAPVLSDIFLSGVDRSIHDSFNTLPVRNVFRYVDDFFIVYGKRVEGHGVHQVVETFVKCGSGLKFTFEEPKDGTLQFLDLSLSAQANHLCWSYSSRSKKAILPYTSSHSKIVKRGIAMSILGSALEKSCFHTVKDSCRSQLERLKASGYPHAVLIEVMGSLLKKVKGESNSGQNIQKNSPGRSTVLA